MRENTLRLVAVNGRSLPWNGNTECALGVPLEDEEFFDELDRDIDFETAALSARAFADVFTIMRERLEKRTEVSAEQVENLRVAFDEFALDLSRRKLAR